MKTDEFVHGKSIVQLTKIVVTSLGNFNIKICNAVNLSFGRGNYRPRAPSFSIFSPSV